MSYKMLLKIFPKDLVKYIILEYIFMSEKNAKNIVREKMKICLSEFSQKQYIRDFIYDKIESNTYFSEKVKEKMKNADSFYISSLRFNRHQYKTWTVKHSESFYVDKNMNKRGLDYIYNPEINNVTNVSHYGGSGSVSYYDLTIPHKIRKLNNL